MDLQMSKIGCVNYARFNFIVVIDPHPLLKFIISYSCMFTYCGLASYIVSENINVAQLNSIPAQNVMHVTYMLLTLYMHI